MVGVATGGEAVVVSGVTVVTGGGVVGGKDGVCEVVVVSDVTVVAGRGVVRNSDGVGEADDVVQQASVNTKTRRQSIRSGLQYLTMAQLLSQIW